jgi:PPM family protein phosphatase
VPSDLEAWPDLRGSLEQRRAVWTLVRRFRRDPVTYLRSMEDFCIRKALPPRFSLASRTDAAFNAGRGPSADPQIFGRRLDRSPETRASRTMNLDDLSDTREYPPPPSGPAMQARSSSATIQADLAGQSHQGKVRPNNEDHFLIFRFGRFLRTLATNLPDGHVPPDHVETGYGMIVADGMGGMAAGEAASRMAISFLIERTIETPDWILAPDEALMEEVIARAAGRFRAVNEAIVEQARHDPGLTGMGTTLTMALSLGTDLLIAHVGDSPAYLFRQGELHKLTRDHTLAQELADQGQIPARDVASHRYRNVLTHAIGIRGTGDQPEIRRLRLADGDRLLLCTDGLTDMVDDATIGAELRRQASSGEACRALIDLALDRGGRDNVTVVVAGYCVPSGP